MSECIEAMDDVLRALARGELHQPLRSMSRPPEGDGLIGLMPAHRGGRTPVWSLKEIVITPDNPTRGLDPAPGSRAAARRRDGRAARDHERLADHRDPHGRGLCSRDASAGASRRARRRDPRRRRAGALARGGDERRPPRRPRSGRGSAATAAPPRRPSSGADVVCTCTSAREPIVQREWLARRRPRERGRLEHPGRRASSTPRRWPTRACSSTGASRP